MISRVIALALGIAGGIVLFAPPPAQTRIVAAWAAAVPRSAVQPPAAAPTPAAVTPQGAVEPVGVLQSAPSLSAEQVDTILASYNSPAHGSGEDFYRLGVQWGIDPAYPLAFFVMESSAGTDPRWDGIKPDGSTTHDIGNISCAGYPTCYGRWRDYPDWKTGIDDWYRLISVEYIQGRGHRTVDDVIPIYAPAFENDVGNYTNVVNALVGKWREQYPLSAPTPITVPTSPPASTGSADLTFVVDDGLQVDEAGTRDALRVVSEAFGSGPKGQISVVYTIDPDCALHGVTHPEDHTVQTMTCNAFSTGRAISIMAHEFVHQLAYDRYGTAGTDLALAEGVATWGARAYWLGNGDFRNYMRTVGVQYPLTQSYEGLGYGAQNAMYYQWASFVEFLIGTYGREKFDQVYVSGKGAPGSADYQGVYNKNISTLENEWKGWIQS